MWNLQTNWLTPCGRVLLEKLIFPQTIKKFPASYRTKKFVILLTRVRLLSFSSIASIHLTHPSCSFKIRFNIIFPSRCRLSRWSLSLRFSHLTSVCNSFRLHKCHTTCQSYRLTFDHWLRYSLTKYWFHLSNLKMSQENLQVIYWSRTKKPYSKNERV